MSDYKDLRVWREAVSVATLSFEYGTTLPQAERYGLRSQIQRAAVSVPSNIAEGSARKSPRDFQRFLRMAYGSACELETQIFIAEQVGIGDSSKATELLGRSELVRRMLAGLISSIGAKRQTPDA